MIAAMYEWIAQYTTWLVDSLPYVCVYRCTIPLQLNNPKLVTLRAFLAGVAPLAARDSKAFLEATAKAVEVMAPER